MHELQNHCLLMNNIMYARVEYSSSRYPPPPSSLNRHHNPTNPQSTPPPSLPIIHPTHTQTTRLPGITPSRSVTRMYKAGVESPLRGFIFSIVAASMLFEVRRGAGSVIGPSALVVCDVLEELRCSVFLSSRGPDGGVGVARWPPIARLWCTVLLLGMIVVVIFC